MSQPTIHFYEFGPFRLDAVKRLLWREGEVVPLKSKDFDLLLALVSRSGQMLDKDDLIRQVWPDSIVEEGNLSVHIFALRRALGETPDDHRYIVTAPGRGYSFVANVREAPDEGEETASSSTSLSAAQRAQLEPVGGAVPLGSRFYLERETDREFRAAVARRDSVVLVKGAWQVGKTSLLARSLQQAREAGRESP
jgi:DNA-binding winged helix-turn-helix (wHTH) protein